MESMNKDRFSADLIHKIKESVNLIEVVGEHVVLRKTGGNYVGLCPFHSERTPSFSVNENKQLYHCYGCKKGGDLVTFVMEILGLSFAEALEELADRARIALPQSWMRHDSPEQSEQDRLKKEKIALAYKLNRFVAAYFHQQLMGSSPEALSYLERRGVGGEAIKGFYLGAAQDSWHHLCQHLERQKAPLDLACELGLMRPSQKAHLHSRAQESAYFDLFRHRVMFPIVNMRGKVAGFGGRVLGSQESPKYLNSSDSVVFQKSKLAFGLFQAQKHIREKDEIILVEGYFDVLALHAAGFQNAVATCGTSLTPDHLNLFKRFASKVIVLFDGDSAGISATQRAMEVGLDQGWVLHSAELPSGLDPDEILFDPHTGKAQVSGVERMKGILAQAQPMIDLKLNQSIKQGRQSPEDQAQAIKQMAGWLSRFNDSIGREVRVQYVTQQLGISQSLLLEAMGQKSGTAVKGSSQKMSSHARVSVQVRDRHSGSGVEFGNASPQKPKPLNFHTQHKPQVNPLQGDRMRAGVQSPESQVLGPVDRILLQGVILGGGFWDDVQAVKGDFPPEINFKDLLEYLPAQKWVDQYMKEAAFRGRVPQSEWLERGTQDLDPMIREVLTAILVGQSTPLEREDFQTALKKRLARNWARFSQKIKHQISQAELRNDAELHTKLMKEYLDVQRKMKDFNSFYDEA